MKGAKGQSERFGENPHLAFRKNSGSQDGGHPTFGYLRVSFTRPKGLATPFSMLSIRHSHVSEAGS